MTGHLLVVELDESEQAKLDAGELIFPEHVESHVHGIACHLGDNCKGWIKCLEPHEIDGTSAECGPHDCDCSDDKPSCLGEGANRAPWDDEDEFEFHGVIHTWRGGHGWTVPFTRGCIVAFGDYELPYECEDLAIGEYAVDTEWDDTNCQLILASTAT